MTTPTDWRLHHHTEPRLDVDEHRADLHLVLSRRPGNLRDTAERLAFGGLKEHLLSKLHQSETYAAAEAARGRLESARVAVAESEGAVAQLADRVAELQRVPAPKARELKALDDARQKHQAAEADLAALKRSLALLEKDASAATAAVEGHLLAMANAEVRNNLRHLLAAKHEAAEQAVRDGAASLDRYLQASAALEMLDCPARVRHFTSSLLAEQSGGEPPTPSASMPDEPAPPEGGVAIDDDELQAARREGTRR